MHPFRSPLRLVIALLVGLTPAAGARAATLPPGFVSAFGDTGSAPGEFSHPRGMCADLSGNLYVVDALHARIQKFSGSGTFLTLWGSAGDAPGQLDLPFDVACDSSGDVYVLEWGSGRVQVFDGNGTLLRGWGPAAGAGGSLLHPTALGLDGAANVYVADAGHHRVVKFANDGSFLLAWGSAGTGAGQFGQMRGLALNRDGELYVVDSGNDRVQKFWNDGTFLLAWGSTGGGDGQFRTPLDVAVDADGDVYVTDRRDGDSRVQVFDGAGTFLASWGAFVPPSAPAGSSSSALAPNLTIDGAQTFQTMVGMGVNANVQAWAAGQLAPALELLAGPGGVTDGAALYRVIRDPMTWVASESDIAPLHALDPATLTRVYEAPAMRDLWDTIGYLNAIGVRGDRIVLNFMGWTPTWIGGSGAYGIASHVTAGKEGELATMLASLVYYGRTARGLDFRMLSPLNEPDWDCREGPCVAAGQYATVAHALAAELDGMGMTDVRLMGPDCASPPNADAYITSMMADPVVASRIDHFGLHYYGSVLGPRTPYAGHDYVLTEFAATCSSCDQSGGPSQGEWAFASGTGDIFLGSLQAGMPGILVWDGYDSFYYHHNTVTYWGLMALNAGVGTWAPRKRFYVNAQVTGFVRPGSRRVYENDSVNSLGTVAAFVDAATGVLTIEGHNTGSTPVEVRGQVANLPSPTSLAAYYTDDGARNMARDVDVVVSAGAFTDTIPANAFFTLTSSPAGRGAFRGIGGIAIDAIGHVFVSSEADAVIRTYDARTSGAAPPPTPRAFGIESVGPNPGRGDRLIVRFRLEGSAPARLDLMDLGGRRVSSRDLGGLAAGPHALVLEPDRRLVSGVYFLRLLQGARTAKARVAVLE